MKRIKIPTNLRKHLTKYRPVILGGVIILVAIYGIIWIRNDSLTNENPGLLEPRKNYDRSVELSPTDKAKYEQQVQEYTSLIDERKAQMKTTPTVSGDLQIENLPDEMRFVWKAQALQALGKYTEAIESINELFGYYDESIMGRDALGNIYRDLEEYKRAISNFQKIVEINGDEGGVYAKKIAKIYVELGDGQTAGQWYIKYEQNGGKRSTNLMNDIRALNK